MDKISKFITIIGTIIICFFIGYYLKVIVPENNKKADEMVNLLKDIKGDVYDIRKEVKDMNPNKSPFKSPF